MFKFLLTTMFFLLSFMQPATAFDDLEPHWTLDLSYHYARVERSTNFSNINFLSRSGAMLQFEYTESFSLFWRYYLGGDFAVSSFEAPGSNTIRPREIFPWQSYGGLAAQLGSLKNLEFFVGAGTSTEYYQRLSGVQTYTMDQTYSLRAHLGLTYRLISIVGSTARLMLRYSLPITRVEHFDEALSYKGILDGTLRIRPRYDSTFSFYSGIRFEDYATADESITYFSTRIHAGVGVHF